VGQASCLPSKLPQTHLLDGIEWLLFDAVGTLIYPDPPVAEAYRSVGQGFGSRLSHAEIRQRFGEAFKVHHAQGEATSEANERQRWRKIVASVFTDMDERTDVLFERLWSHFADPLHWQTFDDTTALSALRRRGYQLGIASNFDSRLKAIVAQQPRLADVQAIFVSSEVGHTKPDLRFFRAIENALQLESAKIALVGDDDVADVQGATSAGWRAIRVDRSNTSAAPGTIRSLTELL
jgi:putative hydrolase of the HAD superfamily